MKKSTSVLLSAMFLAAVSSCQQAPEQKDEWITAKSKKKDTVVNNHTYRHYNGAWYPVYAGRINPGVYQGYSNSEIHSTSASSRITPTKVSSFSSSSSSHATATRSGGFGSSAHVSAGS